MTVSEPEKKPLWLSCLTSVGMLVLAAVFCVFMPLSAGGFGKLPSIFGMLLVTGLVSGIAGLLPVVGVIAFIQITTSNIVPYYSSIIGVETSWWYFTFLIVIGTVYTVWRNIQTVFYVRRLLIKRGLRQQLGNAWENIGKR